MSIKAIGFGAGGHAKVVIEILALHNEVQIVGLLDRDTNLVGKNLLGIPILGGDDFLRSPNHLGITHFFIGTGGIPNFALRKHLFELGCASKLEPLSAIHPSAILSSSATIGKGVTVMPRVVVNASARIEANVILNTACVVEHDCRVGAHSHIAPGGILCGNVEVEEEVRIGAGAIVRQGIHVGCRSVIGAGAVVVHNVKHSTTVVGVPARLLERVPTRSVAAQNV